MTIPSELEHVFDVPVNFEAVLQGPELSVRALLALSEGSLIKTSRPAGETVEVFAAGALIGFAEITDAEGHRAVRMVRFHDRSR
jgi:flagellar motor switch/type III secretory pathway protein FliN